MVNAGCQSAKLSTFKYIGGRQAYRLIITDKCDYLFRIWSKNRCDSSKHILTRNMHSVIFFATTGASEFKLQKQKTNQKIVAWQVAHKIMMSSKLSACQLGRTQHKAYFLSSQNQLCFLGLLIFPGNGKTSLALGPIWNVSKITQRIIPLPESIRSL